MVNQKKMIHLKYLILEILYTFHSVHWGINPTPQKHHPLFLAKPPPPLNLQTVQAPFLDNPPYILAFREPP